MYPVYLIDRVQAEHIINIQESFLTDVKAKEIKPAKLSETVSAFANATGGDLYIGITEDRATNARGWVGFSDVEDANDIIQSLFQAHSFGNHLKFEFLSCEGYPGYVLHITVKKVKEIVRSTSGEIYVRINAGKAKIDTNEKRRRLELDKGVITFEDEWVEAPLRKVENSHAIINFMLNVIPNAEPLTYLENQELVKKDHVKVSGILLFCDEPAVYLPKRCSVKLMRYKTKEETIDREFLDGTPMTIEGVTYDVIYSSVSKTREVIEGAKKLGKSGLENVQYPDETLHEIITNAILHRDYSIAADVQIRVYDNRVEVESPGRLPGHVTIGNILSTQSARNPMLVRLINKFPDPPNQDVGEGLDTAFRAMEALRLKRPTIVETADSVLVKIVHESLGSPEELVMEYLDDHEEINNRTARELTGIKSENTMKDVFIRLKDRKMLEQIPERRGSKAAWRKPTSDVPKP